MSRPEAMRALLVVFALVPSLASSVSAQVFTGAVQPMNSATAAAAPVPLTPAVPRTLLRHFPSTLDGLALTGESAELRWPVSLTAAQAGGALRLRIGYKSSVSSLPDASILTVQVNGQLVGTDVIDAPRGLRIVEFEVPAGLAQPGFNAVSISVRQRHRVDCSVAATYELWTRIDPAETGLVVSYEARGIASTAELPALSLRTDGSLPIHILLHGKTTGRNVERLIKATAAISLAAHAQQPIVDFADAHDEPFGLDLAVGSRTALKGDPRLADALGQGGAVVRVVPTGAFARPVLIATGDTEAELDQAVAQIAPAVPAVGSSAGIAAATAYPGTKTEGDEMLRLRDLGVGSEEFSGRLLRKTFNLALPADFLAADYGRGTFDLAGAYASGLAHGAQVRVDINGKSSGVIKLPFAGGDVFRHNQLFLPLSLMRPGLNRVEIFAETPRLGDATCEAADGKRFLLTDNSKIVLPTLARVQRLPDLAVTAAGALPYAQGGAQLVVPAPDRETVGSALSIAARASVAAGKVIPFVFSMHMPHEAAGSILVVSPARALDPDVLRDIGLDPKVVEAAWRDTAANPQPSQPVQNKWWLASDAGPAACRLPSTARLPAGRMETAATAAPTPLAASAKPDTGDLLEDWSEERQAHRDWVGMARIAVEGMLRWTHSVAFTVSGAVQARLRTHDAGNGIAPEASLILAQGMSAGSSDAVTTIVTAPTAAMLHAAVPCLTDPRVWSELRGRLAVLDASNGAVTTTAATSVHYVGAQKGSLGNSRLVLAGWFSLDPLAFVAVAMMLAVALSGTTLWFVRGVGRRPE